MKKFIKDAVLIGMTLAGAVYIIGGLILAISNYF